MTDYFGEKTGQVEPGSLTAFGISIVSRYNKADEIIEMLKFSQQVALKGIAQYVTEVFYDSKADLCSFTLTESVQDGDPIAAELLSAARNSINQFQWFGYIHHGGSLLEEQG